MYYSQPATTPGHVMARSAPAALTTPSSGTKPKSPLERPDLMPLTCKALIGVLKHHETCAEHNIACPHFVIFHGAPGNGKATLINETITSIGADPVQVEMRTLAVKHSAPTSNQDSRDKAIKELVETAYKQAETNESGYAVIVINELDTINDQTMPHMIDLHNAFHKEIKASKEKNKQHLLILGKSKIPPQAGSLKWDEDIEVPFPNEKQRKQIAEYYLATQHKIDFASESASTITSKTNGMTVRDIELLTRRAAILSLTNKPKCTNILKETIEQLAKEMRHAGHDMQVAAQTDQYFAHSKAPQSYIG